MILSVSLGQYDRCSNTSDASKWRHEDDRHPDHSWCDRLLVSQRCQWKRDWGAHPRSCLAHWMHRLLVSEASIQSIGGCAGGRPTIRKPSCSWMPLTSDSICWPTPASPGANAVEWYTCAQPKHWRQVIPRQNNAQCNRPDRPSCWRLSNLFAFSLKC